MEQSPSLECNSRSAS